MTSVLSRGWRSLPVSVVFTLGACQTAVGTAGPIGLIGNRVDTIQTNSLIAQGGGNLVAQGGGNFVLVSGFAQTSQGLNTRTSENLIGLDGVSRLVQAGVARERDDYGLLQFPTGLKIVNGAEVYLTDLRGDPIAKAESTALDERGRYVFSVLKGLTFLVAVRARLTGDRTLIPTAPVNNRILTTLASSGLETNRHDISLGSTLATAKIVQDSGPLFSIDPQRSAVFFEKFNQLAPVFDNALQDARNEKARQQIIVALPMGTQSIAKGTATPTFSNNPQPLASLVPVSVAMQTLSQLVDIVFTDNATLKSLIAVVKAGVMAASTPVASLTPEPARTSSATQGPAPAVATATPTPGRTISPSERVRVTDLAGRTKGAADGTGSAAQFFSPHGVAVDPAGNLYVVDHNNHRIRKVTQNGVVTTLAGSTAGYADGTGSEARFSFPTSVAAHRAGTLYVADQSNHCIRRITPDGMVTTLAGGQEGYLDATGTAAQFRNPYGLAIDRSGDIYVSDTFNHCIRRVSPTGVVTTVAGSVKGYTDGKGAASQFNLPTGIAVDDAKNVYVADSGNRRLRRINPDGVVTTLAGSIKGYTDGKGADAQFDHPVGVAVDQAGNVYVADAGNHQIRLVGSDGTVISLPGLGEVNDMGSLAQFDYPQGVAVDDAGHIYVADTDNHRIRKIQR